MLDAARRPYTHGLVESLPDRAFTPIPTVLLDRWAAGVVALEPI